MDDAHILEFILDWTRAEHMMRACTIAAKYARTARRMYCCCCKRVDTEDVVWCHGLGHRCIRCMPACCRRRSQYQCIAWCSAACQGGGPQLLVTQPLSSLMSVCMIIMLGVSPCMCVAETKTQNPKSAHDLIAMRHEMRAIHAR